MRNLRKKIVAISIVVVMLLGFMPVINVNADTTPIVTMTSSKTYVEAGEEFVVSINFENGIEVQKALSFSVNYDSTKLTVKYDYIETDLGQTTYMLGDDDGESLNRQMGNRLTYGRILDNIINIAFAAKKAVPSSGNLANITFTAKEGFNTETVISINSIKCSTEDDDFVYPQTASVTINPVIELESISVSQPSVTLEPGETSTISVTKNPANATNVPEITYSSDNESVATVDNTGKITAVSKGNANITVTCGTKTATVAVTVSVSLKGLNINESTYTLNINESTTVIRATKNPVDTDDMSDINWTSSNEGIVKITNSVGENPTLTAVGKGTAVVTATCGAYSAQCTVTVNVPLQTINLVYSGTNDAVGDKIVVEKGSTVSIIGSKYPSNTSVEADVVFSIDASSVATVNSSGVITGVDVGTTTLNVSCAGTTYKTVTVQVIASITAINIVGGNITINKGQTHDLSVSYEPANPTSPTAIIWSSNNEAVATVDSNGSVYAVSTGTATIKATLVSDSSIYSEIEVLVPVVSATQVNINKNTTSIEQGESEKLTAYLLPDDTTDTPVYTWSSSDETVATVDNTGNVKAVNPGTAEITASFGALKATCSVKVTRKLDSINLNMTEITLAKGQKSDQALEVIYNPTNTTVDKSALVLKSLNESVAKLDANNYIEAVSAGTVIIQAIVDEKIAECTVKVIVPLVSVVIDNKATNMELVKGKTGDMTVTLNPVDATTEVLEYTWSSSDETVAKVDNNGKVTAISAGTATITVDYGSGITSSRNVVVQEIPVTGIVLDNTIETVLKGENNSIILEPKAYPENTTDALNFTFESSDPEIATVDSSGKIVGKKSGEVTITLKLNDTFTKTLNLTIKEIPLSSIGLANGENEFATTEGADLYLNIIPTPADTTDELGFVYTSSNESIATVDDNGKVTAKKAGIVYITVVSATNSNISTQVKINVSELDISGAATDNPTGSITGGTTGGTTGSTGGSNSGTTGSANGGSESAVSSVVATATVLAGSTVTSPHTGDMNVELLVAMLILSILGMVVVIKKK